MMTGMDSQFIANLISGISALATVVAAIYTRRQAIGSKEAKAKAEESHKAALDMRDAAQRSAKAAEEQANQAEKLLERMQQLIAEQQSQSQSQSKIAASLQASEFELTNVPRTSIFNLRNVTMGPIKILEVVNLSQFIDKKNLKETVEKEFGSGEMVRITLDYYGDDNNLRLRIDGRDNILCVPIEYNRKS